MSCFESSTFLKNNAVMSQDILCEACDKLGWQYLIKAKDLHILQFGKHQNLYGEYAIKVVGNTVTYNTYYLKNGKGLVNELQAEYALLQNELNVKYAEQSILQAFKAKGFSFRSNEKFVADDLNKISFFMEATSLIKEETEKTIKIKFTIGFDGTIVTDSNYIPHDVHELADDAMATVEQHFGRTRSIAPKAIPPQYVDKAYCKPKNIQNLNLK